MSPFPTDTAPPFPANSLGHVLLAHGSRDPAWSAAIEAVAARVWQMDSAARVRCAYLELAQPDLSAVLDGLIAEGARTIAVWPMFLGLGRHAREDLPRQVANVQARIRERHPGVTIMLCPAIAEHASVLDAMARVILHKFSDF